MSKSRNRNSVTGEMPWKSTIVHQQVMITILTLNTEESMTCCSNQMESIRKENNHRPASKKAEFHKEGAMEWDYYFEIYDWVLFHISLFVESFFQWDSSSLTRSGLFLDLVGVILITSDIAGDKARHSIISFMDWIVDKTPLFTKIDKSRSLATAILLLLIIIHYPFLFPYIDRFILGPNGQDFPRFFVILYKFIDTIMMVGILTFIPICILVIIIDIFYNLITIPFHISNAISRHYEIKNPVSLAGTVILMAGFVFQFLGTY